MKTKPKILMVVDRLDWAFGYIATSIQSQLSEDFTFTIITLDQEFNEENYDLIYLLNWAMYRDLKLPIRDSSKYICGIRSHKSWRKLDFSTVISDLTTRFVAVQVINEKLYKNFSPFIKDIVFLDDGVDIEYFSPTQKNKGIGKHIVVGWAGNSSEPSKNFKQLVQPLEKIQGIKLLTCGHDTRQLNRAEMKQFYHDIDVYLCASTSEGNSTVVLEAAAMGKPVITTESGTVPEWLKDEHNALIVQEELPHIISSIFRIKQDSELAKRLGRNIQASVRETYDWRKIMPGYKDFFTKALRGGYEITPTALGRELIAAAPLKDPSNYMLEEYPSILIEKNMEINTLKTELGVLKLTQQNNSAKFTQKGKAYARKLINQFSTFNKNNQSTRYKD